MATVTISIPDSMKEFIDGQVRTKGYGNVSEYFRTLVRDAQSKEAESRLESLLLEGLDSGEEIEITREFWRELRSEALRRVGHRQGTDG